MHSGPSFSLVSQQVWRMREFIQSPDCQWGRKRIRAFVCTCTGCLFSLRIRLLTNIFFFVSAQVWWLRRRGSVKISSPAEPAFANAEYGSPHRISLSIHPDSQETKPEYANGLVDNSNTLSLRTKSVSSSLPTTTPTSPDSTVSVFLYNAQKDGQGMPSASNGMLRRQQPREVVPYRTTSILSSELKVREVSPYMKPVDVLSGPLSATTPGDAGPCRRLSSDLNTLTEETPRLSFSEMHSEMQSLTPLTPMTPQEISSRELGEPV